MNLYEKIRQEMGEGREFWDYYKTDEIFSYEDKNVARKFIQSYFTAGSKQYVIREWCESDIQELSFRNIHTVNVFFIGIIIQRVIDANLCLLSEMGEDYSFSYLWYLTCLSHDLGYIYENVQRQERRQKYQQLYERQKKYKYAKCPATRLTVYRYERMNIWGLVPGELDKRKYCRKKCRIAGIGDREDCENKCKEALEFSNGIRIEKFGYSSLQIKSQAEINEH